MIKFSELIEQSNSAGLLQLSSLKEAKEIFGEPEDSVSSDIYEIHYFWDGILQIATHRDEVIFMGVYELDKKAAKQLYGLKLKNDISNDYSLSEKEFLEWCKLKGISLDKLIGSGETTWCGLRHGCKFASQTNGAFAFSIGVRNQTVHTIQTRASGLGY